MMVTADPEEFLNMLFKHTLHVDPFILIKYVYLEKFFSLSVLKSSPIADGHLVRSQSFSYSCLWNLTSL